MSVRVTLSCKVNPEQYQALIPFVEENLANVRGFKGNRRVTVLYDEANHEMLLDEEWQDRESHQAYIQAISDNGVLGQLASHLLSPPDIKYFQLLSI